MAIKDEVARAVAKKAFQMTQSLQPTGEQPDDDAAIMEAQMQMGLDPSSIKEDDSYELAEAASDELKKLREAASKK